MTMSPTADLVAYNPDGKLTLLVEVKSRTDTSRDWATRMRRNMLARGLAPDSRFLLIALPDRLYLWKDAGNTPDLIEPTYEFDATPFFKPYLKIAHLSQDELNHQSLELIVSIWLNEIIRSGIPDDTPAEQRKLLQESGLIEALQGGSVAVELGL
jgi:hypothetical protein